jgi:heptosyltransferase-2
MDRRHSGIRRAARGARGGGPAGAHVAVVQTSFLGDVVLTTPLIAALRSLLRPARLSVVVRPEAAPLLAHHPCVDQVIVDDKRGRDGGPAGLLRIVRRLRAQRVDVAVVPHRSLRTALVVAAAGISWRVGFADSRGARLYHVRVPRDRRRHDVERNLGLLAAFDAQPGAYLEAPRLVAGPAAEERAARWLADPRLSDARRLYGLCPGSVWPTKRWSAAGFGAVARALASAGDARVLIFGGVEDAAVGRAVEEHAGGAAVNLAGTADLETFIALVRHMRAVVANDSAPMHIAAACGVPVVAVFCATTPAQGYGPHGGAAEVVGADLACRPCGRHGGRTCPRGTEDCVHLVTAAQVLAALSRVAVAPRAGG